MSLEKARFNMIEQQIRPWNVLDFDVLETLKSVPRENFVPNIHRSLAFADIEIPLGHGETMMHPRVEGKLLQELAILPSDTCLEIGTGSGYLTACLAKLSTHVHSVEIHEDLSHIAQNNLDSIGVMNASLMVGDAANDWQTQPNLYNIIAITASMPRYNNRYEKKLAVGGRLFVVVGKENSIQPMQAILVTRTSPSQFSRVSLLEMPLKTLIMQEKEEPVFVF
jgi:protein-L-isoaspartate(D-aspartate) O-methyltransferase